MVFNSSQNNFNSTNPQAESFEVLRNSYNVSEGGYDYQPALRPSNGKDFMFPTAVHSMVSHYDQNELKYLNHDTMRSREELSGNGIRRQIRKVMPKDELVGEGFFKKAGKSVRKTTTKTANKTSSVAKSGAKATKKGAEKLNRDTKPLQKKIAKSVTDEDGLLHKAIGKTLDVAIPAAGEALGAAASTYFTGDPKLGAMVGKKAGQVGRNELKKKTGYGVKGVGQYDKGNIDLEKTLNKYAPQYRNDVIRQKKPAVCKKPASGRCDVVKKIMKEKGISLPAASKYVKENNLW
jgi:hypothetical protein